MSTTAEKQPGTNGTVAKVQQDNTAQQVLKRVKEFTANRELKLPPNYSPENALKSAWLILQDVKDRAGNYALQVCTNHSIANTLFDMVVQGLNPVKKQCYFVVYGKELKLMRSYQGAEAVAKRVGNVKEITGVPIYEGDVFEFEIEKNGRRKITKHEQKLENIDHEKVKGAYAIVVYNDGETDAEIMNIKQIRKAWEQGAGKGNSGAHNNFTDEMAIKTCINRACKKIINSTDDSDLYQGDDVPGDIVAVNVAREVKDNANRTEIGFDDPQPVEVLSSKPGEHQADEIENVSDNQPIEGPGF